MAQISEHINYSNQKIHCYDQMIKIIGDLGSTRVKNNNNYSLPNIPSIEFITNEYC